MYDFFSYYKTYAKHTTINYLKKYDTYREVFAAQFRDPYVATYKDINSTIEREITLTDFLNELFLKPHKKPNDIYIDRSSTRPGIKTFMAIIPFTMYHVLLFSIKLAISLFKLCLALAAFCLGGFLNEFCRALSLYAIAESCKNLLFLTIGTIVLPAGLLVKACRPYEKDETSTTTIGNKNEYDSDEYDNDRLQTLSHI